MSFSEHSIDTSHFKRISLLDAEKAQLLQRIDSKYIIPVETAIEILKQNSNSYFIVENNSQVIPEYISMYFDTSNFSMYIDHHNRRPKRYKIRLRNYCASGDSFMEIKIKVPSGKTIKKRIQTENSNIFQTNISEFIKTKSPYSLESLEQRLETRFNRLTLVSREFNERITFDFNILLSIPNSSKSVLFDDICILEVKRDKLKANSKIVSLLKAMGIKPMGFSKYSIGCSLLYPAIKHNNFKEILLYINKLRHEHTKFSNAI